MSMNPYPLSFLCLVGGCATALDPTHRLTEFRETLFQEGVLRDLTIDGYRYCVAELGEGSPIVLVHGLGGSLYDWRHVLRPLAEEHRVLAVDLLGAGESDLPENEDYSIAAQARRLRGLLDALDVERPALVGNSYGGGIVLRFAEDWPERVDRMVLLNSVCYAEHIPAYVSLAKVPCAGCVAEVAPLGKATRWILGNNDRTLSILSETEFDVYTQELLRPGRRRALVEVLRAIVPPDTREFEARLRTIRAPALLIWGAADTTIPVELGRRLSRELPNAQLVELDAGHVPNQERPQDVLRLMRGFLP
ncbi:MAG TPA: alpha/beta hydrolase [Planctomycetota bacterium]|nr:alpha/beta hydrolase [Planctomycetota bacterium]